MALANQRLAFPMTDLRACFTFTGRSEMSLRLMIWSLLSPSGIDFSSLLLVSQVTVKISVE